MNAQNQLYRAAIHEAGHALSFYLIQGNIDDIEFIEIYTGGNDSVVPTGGGLCEVTNEATNRISIPYNKEGGEKYWFNLFCIQVAGVYAESIFFNDNINTELLEQELLLFTEKNRTISEMCGLFKTDCNGNVIFDLLKKRAITFIKTEFLKAKNMSLIEEIANTLYHKKENFSIKRMFPEEISIIINKGACQNSDKNIILSFRGACSEESTP